jgi:uncharacterized protein YjbJ (UPF0337 family)
MNAATLSGKWNQLKGAAQQKWGKLTDDDLDKIDRSKDELIGVLQERYGREREAIEEEVNTWETWP